MKILFIYKNEFVEPLGMMSLSACYFFKVRYIDLSELLIRE
jgi:hypothetical protein